jgi:hypothetical protein
MMPMPAPLKAILATAFVLFAVPAATAHHGWAWTTGNNIKLAGRIEEVRLGNPHGILRVRVDVGQPWRDERAGLEDGDFAPGVEATVYGEPAARIEDKRLKVERLEINGRMYELYPERK